MSGGFDIRNVFGNLRLALLRAGCEGEPELVLSRDDVHALMRRVQADLRPEEVNGFMRERHPYNGFDYLGVRVRWEDRRGH